MRTDLIPQQRPAEHVAQLSVFAGDRHADLTACELGVQFGERRRAPGFS